MPTVNRYADGSGFFVTANPGAEHPINIRTRPEMDEIFEELDFGQKTEISHDLCWTLYDTGLIYTKNSHEAPAEGIDGDLDFEANAVSLTQEQREKLLEVIQDYSGSERVDKLRDVLEEHSSFTNRSSSNTGSSEGKSEGDALREFLDQDTEEGDTGTDSYSLKDEVREWLDAWSPVFLSGDKEIEREELGSGAVSKLNQSTPRFADLDRGPAYIHITEYFRSQ